MPELENNENLDPIVLAAMIEDPNEDDDVKALRKEILEDETPAPKAAATDEDEDEDDDAPTSDEDEDEDDKKPKPTKKPPVEAEDDEEDLDEDQDEDLDDDDKTTRKDKRQKRKADYEMSVLKDRRSTRDPVQIPNYDPLNYEDDSKEFKPSELKEDRERVGAIQFAKGAEAVRYWADQDKFWSELNSEAKITSFDPKLDFLSETKPDGTKNPNFDADKAEDINGAYLQAVGFKQFHRTNEQGQPLYDRATGQPIVVSTVQRTDISYEKFARREIAKMKRWAKEEADDQVETTTKAITTTRKNQGIRPSGGKRKSLGAIRPGDISKMSDEELEKNEAEINRQILEML